MLKTLSQKSSPASSALVVIDMQNDFCHKNGTSAARGLDIDHVQGIVPNLQSLLDRARAVGTPIIFVRVSLTDETVAENFRERLDGRPFPCREDSWGADWFGVAPMPGDFIISKRRFSAFIGTGIHQILQARGIKN